MLYVGDKAPKPADAKAGPAFRMVAPAPYTNKVRSIVLGGVDAASILLMPALPGGCGRNEPACYIDAAGDA